MRAAGAPHGSDGDASARARSACIETPAVDNPTSLHRREPSHGQSGQPPIHVGGGARLYTTASARGSVPPPRPRRSPVATSAVPRILRARNSLASRISLVKHSSDLRMSYRLGGHGLDVADRERAGDRLLAVHAQASVPARSLRAEQEARCPALASRKRCVTARAGTSRARDETAVAA
jgi:hypothetical protein